MKPVPRLTREQLIALSSKSIENARALIEEGELLWHNGHWARAMFLCHTAGEEFGKCIACLSASVNLARGVIDWRKFWKRILSHPAKTRAIDVFETVILKEPEDEPEYFNKLDTQIQMLIQARNATLYSSVFSDGTVFSPTDVMTEKIAKDSLSWAKGRLRLIEAMILPILNSKVVKASDEALKKAYDEMAAILSDSEKREGFLAALQVAESQFQLEDEEKA